ncbi:MAG: UDP-N-acetylmuramate dehydrogenase [Bacteroidota bacterium]
MQIYQDFPLQAYNTFGIAAQAKQFSTIHSVTDLLKVIEQNKEGLPLFLLGGGSNLLLRADLPYWVLKNEIKGIRHIEDYSDTAAVVAVGAGENWHQFVLWTIQNNLGGAENLSLIPGTVGAAPIQNIGAYGVELKDIFERLEAVRLSDGKLQVFNKDECQFAYRNSIFKQQHKGKYAIVRVFFRLQKKPSVNVSYGALQHVLKEKGILHPDIKAVSDAVIAIRQRKLPDPARIGNSGSFFKNPELPRSVFERIQVRFPGMVYYDLPDGRVKVPAGWLIEQCGWKGKRIGNTGAYQHQALVLVNYGNAKGAEVWSLAQQIMVSVQQKFGITIEPEVNVLP